MLIDDWNLALWAFLAVVLFLGILVLSDLHEPLSGWVVCFIIWLIVALIMMGAAWHRTARNNKHNKATADMIAFHPLSVSIKHHIVILPVGSCKFPFSFRNDLKGHEGTYTPVAKAKQSNGRYKDSAITPAFERTPCPA